MAETSKRIGWIDAARMLAIAAVVMCHAVENIYTLKEEYIRPLSLFSKGFCFGAFTLGRLGVPLFLMITGYLLLDRKYDSDNIGRFLKKSWLHLLVCTWIWFLIYEIYIMVSRGSRIGTKQILEDLLFIHKVDMYHVWYLPVILGIYLLIPFIARALQAFELRSLRLPMMIFAAYLFAVPVMNTVKDVLRIDMVIQSQFQGGYIGGAYGFYLICGYLIRKGAFKKYKTWLVGIVGSAGFLMSVLMQLWSYRMNFAYNLWYDNIFLLIASVALFELFSRMEMAEKPVVKFVSYYSFPIYLIHTLFLGWWCGIVGSLPLAPCLQVLLLWVLTTVSSILTAWIINHIPVVGKYILFTK